MSEKWPESKNVPKLQFCLPTKKFLNFEENFKPSKKNEEAIKQHEEELAKKFKMFKAEKGDVFDQLEKELRYSCQILSLAIDLWWPHMLTL